MNAKIYTLINNELIRLNEVLENRELEEGNELYVKYKDRLYDMIDKLIENSKNQNKED